jgi:hypothetical protein
VLVGKLDRELDMVIGGATDWGVLRAGLKQEMRRELRPKVAQELARELWEDPEVVQLERELVRERAVEQAILQNFEIFSSYSLTLDALLVFVRIFFSFLLHYIENGFDSIIRLVCSLQFSLPFSSKFARDCRRMFSYRSFVKWTRYHRHPSQLYPFAQQLPQFGLIGSGF